MSTLEGSEKKAVSVGPWGGQDGLLWDDGVHSMVKQLVIVHGSAAIDSIQIEYDDKGASVWSNRHGGNGGWKTDEVRLACPEEYLTSIEGHYGKINEWGPVSIKSLTFKSNKTTYGPFGIEQGTPFSLPATPGSNKIVGFHGKVGWYLEAIGAYLKPLDQNETQPSKPLFQTQCNKYLMQNSDVIFATRPMDELTASTTAVIPPKKLSRQFANLGELIDAGTKVKTVKNSPYTCTSIVPKETAGVITEMDNPYWTNKLLMTNRGEVQEIACRVIKEPAPYGPGPWGGDGGRSWDDGVFSGIRQIHLTREAEGICSMQIEYDRNGQFIWSVKHGGNGGTAPDRVLTAPHRIKLEYPHEVLTCISGYYGCTSKDEKSKIIKSLTFYTSRGKYGPFGEEVGTFFSSGMTEGKVVGFHGRSSLYLDAIGVHMQHWLGNRPNFKASLFKKF